MQYDNMLSVLESYLLPSADEISKKLAADFRARRVEKNITREMMAEKSGVALSNIVRFEQKGLISLTNFIKLAIEMGYLGELKSVFATPKYATISELTEIRRNTGRKKARRKSSEI